jgi:hypothetical protein
MAKAELIQIAKVLYEYFVSNWDHYRVNIHNPNIIKITPTNIKDALREKFPIETSLREQRAKTIIYPWLSELLKKEFEEKGFKVEKKIVKNGNRSKYTILYVYRQ